MKGITFFIEIDPSPVVLRMGWFNSAVMFRVWWLFFAFGWYKMSHEEIQKRTKNTAWIKKSR